MTDGARDIEVVVFDLGGVILDLAGLRAFLDHNHLDRAEFFNRALGSGAHAAFERGAIGPEEYAAAFLAESGLALEPDEFLDEFVDWPGRLLAGAAELLAEIPLPTASLSNTNPLHWESRYSVEVVRPLFDRHFPSYQLRRAKPDPELFRVVARMLEVDTAAVLFFDDQPVNVESARSVGMVTHRVDGPAAARAVLTDRGILPVSGRR